MAEITQEGDNVSLGLERRRPVPITLKDGTKVKVLVHPEILNLPEDEAEEYLEYEFKRQHKQSPLQIMEGALKTLYRGLTLGLADKAVAGAESLFTDKTYEQSLGEYRAPMETFQIQNPKTAAAIEATGAALPIVGEMLLSPTKGTMGTAALRAMQAGKTQSPFRTGLALQRQKALETPTVGINMRETLNPYGLGSSSVLGQSLELAGKGGLTGAAYGFGTGEADLGSSVESAGDVGLFTSGVSAALPPVLRTAGAVARPFTQEGGKSSFENVARSNILGAMKRGGQSITQAVRGGIPDGVTMEQYMSPRYSDIWVQPVTVSPTAAIDRSMPDTGRSQIMAERLGGGVTDTKTGMPLTNNELLAMMRWANSQGDSALASEVRNVLNERIAQESPAMGAAIRRNVDPMPFSTERYRANMTARSKPVWETYYNNAYFAAEGIPNTVPLVSPGRELNLSKLLKGSAIKDAYKTVQANRSNDIATGNWNEVIRGIRQELPNFNSFASGRRNVPATTYRNNRAALEADGWRVVAKQKDPGPKGRVRSLTLENKEKSVDVKTLHDIRGVLDDKITALQNQDKGNEAQKIIQVRAALDDILSNYSPALKAADAEFQNLAGVLEASDLGKTAFQNATNFRDLSARIGGFNPAQQKGYVTGVIESLESGNYKTADILADSNLREKLKQILPEGKLGSTLAELHDINSARKTSEFLGGPFSTEANAGLSGFARESMFRILAKVPAYKFSMEFAAARDIVELSRFLGAKENRIVARETQRILKANNAEELATELGDLSKMYMQRFPTDSAQLKTLSNLIGKVMAADDRKKEASIRTVTGILE